MRECVWRGADAAAQTRWHMLIQVHIEKCTSTCMHARAERESAREREQDWARERERGRGGAGAGGGGGRGG